MVNWQCGTQCANALTTDGAYKSIRGGYHRFIFQLTKGERMEQSMWSVLSTFIINSRSINEFKNRLDKHSMVN